MNLIRILFFPVRIVHRIVYGPNVQKFVGYAWYSEKEYRKLIESSEDDLNLLVASYDKWKGSAERNIEHLKSKGWIVFKVNIAEDQLKEWLKRKGLANISENREAYVKEKMRSFLEDTTI